MEKSRRTNKQKPDRKKTTVTRLVVVSLICTAVVCLTVFLDYNRFWSNQFNDNQNDPNGDAANNPRWAMSQDWPGLPNFHKVSDDLYRGAQPTAEGMSRLKQLGLKTVINLRSLHSDRDELGDIDLAYEHINMTTWNPEIEDVVRFLQIVTDSNCTPAFVHCRYGADRTGTMCAIYRIAVQGWTKDQAIEEMTEGGFGFHTIWMNLVDYIRNLDIEKIKQSAGLNE